MYYRFQMGQIYTIGGDDDGGDDDHDDDDDDDDHGTSLDRWST